MHFKMFRNLCYTNKVNISEAMAQFCCSHASVCEAAGLCSPRAHGSEGSAEERSSGGAER